MCVIGCLCADRPGSEGENAEEDPLSSAISISTSISFGEPGPEQELERPRLDMLPRVRVRPARHPEPREDGIS